MKRRSLFALLGALVVAPWKCLRATPSARLELTEKQAKWLLTTSRQYGKSHAQQLALESMTKAGWQKAVVESGRRFNPFYVLCNPDKSDRL